MELVEPHLTTINANTKKAGLWEEIAEQMNARFPTAVKRNSIQLKENYKKAVTKAKSINAAFKKECVGTGGGPATVKVDPVSLHIIALNKDVPNFSGIDGGVDLEIFPELRKNILSENINK